MKVSQNEVKSRTELNGTIYPLLFIVRRERDIFGMVFNRHAVTIATEEVEDNVEFARPLAIGVGCKTATRLLRALYSIPKKTTKFPMSSRPSTIFSLSQCSFRPTEHVFE